MEKPRKSKCTASGCLCAYHIIKYHLFLYYVLGIHTVASDANVGRSTGSDERAALDQALLLVEILKTEYARVVSENDKLQRKKFFFSEPDAQTCAITTENPLGDPVGYAKLREEARRRFDYDNFLGPQPGINQTQQTASTVASAVTVAPISTFTTVSEPPSPITTMTTDHSELYEYNVTPTTTSTVTTSMIVTVAATNEIVTTKTEAKSRAPISTNNEYKLPAVHNAVLTKTSSSMYPTKHKILTFQNSLPTEKKKLMFSKKVSKAKSISSKLVREPELSQAAAELAKELADAAHRAPVSWRRSTKVYLADSTRYPLPLPENHAFCFTNPHSALCRTLV